MVLGSRALYFRDSEISRDRIEPGPSNFVGRIVLRRRRRWRGDAGRRHGGHLAQHVGQLAGFEVRLSRHFQLRN